MPRRRHFHHHHQLHPHHYHRRRWDDSAIELREEYFSAIASLGTNAWVGAKDFAFFVHDRALDLPQDTPVTRVFDPELAVRQNFRPVLFDKPCGGEPSTVRPFAGKPFESASSADVVVAVFKVFQVRT